MKAANFKKAVELARNQQYDDFGFYQQLKAPDTVTDNGYTFGGYLNNWVGLFSDSDHGYFSLQLNEKSQWVLCYDDEPICRVSPDISENLDKKRAWELGRYERELLEKAEWESEQEELHRNYGYGRA